MSVNCVDLSATGEAKRLVNELLRLESRGAGDLENAMRRLGQRYGMNWRVFWQLRYRNPEDVFVGVFEGLKRAYRAECRRQLRKLEHELQVAQIKGVSVDDLKASADHLVAQLDGEEGL